MISLSRYCVHAAFVHRLNERVAGLRRALRAAPMKSPGMCACAVQLRFAILQSNDRKMGRAREWNVTKDKCRSKIHLELISNVKIDPLPSIDQM